jgi:hypothetical protein
MTIDSLIFVRKKEKSILNKTILLINFYYSCRQTEIAFHIKIDYKIAIQICPTYFLI